MTLRRLPFILAATWVPGLSCVFKVALTALAGLPFRTYLFVGVASQTVAALPYLFAGRVARNMDPATIGTTIFAMLAIVWLIRRHAARKLGRRAEATGAPQ